MQSSKWVTLIFGAICLMAVAGVMTAQNLYYMAAILLTLPGVSYALGWYALRGLTFERELPPTSWAGEEGEIIYIVRNPTRIPRFFLAVQEVLPEWMERIEDAPQLFNVGASDEARIAVRVRFKRRGVYAVLEFEATAMDPLGVFAFGKKVSCAGEIVVYPNPLPLPDLAIEGMERYGWQNLLLTTLRGNSIDPDGVRRYVTGDPLRRIHWRQTARTNQLSVIEFEESYALNLVILLDMERGAIAGHGSENTLEYGIRAAASLGQAALMQGASVGLILSGASALPPGRGDAHLYALLDALARAESNSKETFRETLLNQWRLLPQGATLLLITSNPDTRLAESLAHAAPGSFRAMALFIDPAPFESNYASYRTAQREAFIAALQSSGASAYALRREPEGPPILETLDHVPA